MPLATGRIVLRTYVPKQEINQEGEGAYAPHLQRRQGGDAGESERAKDRQEDDCAGWEFRSRRGKAITKSGLPVCGSRRRDAMAC